MRHPYTPENADEEAFLATYDQRKYPPSAHTADIVILTIRNGDLCILLVRRAAFPYRGYWALPGGFVNPDESIDEAAARELCEETGIEQPGGHMEQLATFGDPDRDPRGRVYSTAYLALLPNIGDPVAGSDAADARWWPVATLGTEDGPGVLAFDHDEIVAVGLERARAKLEWTTLASSFVTEPFTLRDLQQVYEAVWGIPLDRANFRRKVLATDGFVVPTLQRQGDGPGRPAQLYLRGTAHVLSPPIRRQDIPE